MINDDIKILLAKPRMREALERGDAAVYANIIIGLTQWSTNRKSGHHHLAAAGLYHVIVDLMALREILQEGAK